MRPRTISAFWLGYCLGLLSLSEAWEGRDPQPHTQTHPAEGLTMQEWLRLKETERQAVVEAYAQSRPPTRYTTTKERRAALAAD